MSDHGDFDLKHLSMAIFSFKEALEDGDLADEGQQALTTWWNQRKRRVVQHLQGQLESTRPSAETIQQRLWLGLGIYCLQPNHPAGVDALQELLPKFVRQMRANVGKEEANINGDNRTAQSGQKIDILGEQIRDLEALDDQTRALFRMLRYPQNVGISSEGAEFQEATGYCTEIKTELLEPIQNNLTKLYSLRDVVHYVDTNLPGAYLENDSQRWEAIRKRLQGQQDIPGGIRWVSTDLASHVSLRWVSEAYGGLNKRRTELEDAMNQIVWAIQFETLEASEQIKNDTRVASGVRTDESWAAKYIEDERKKAASPLATRSLIEHAAERYRFVQDRAEIPEYIKYTEGTRDRLTGIVARRVKDSKAWHINPDLDSALHSKQVALDSLRTGLLPILGGKLKNSTSMSSYRVWASVFCEAIKLTRQGKFEEAVTHCDNQLSINTPGNLREVLSQLDAKIKGVQNGDVTGMMQWLATFARKRKDELEIERGQIELLKTQIDLLNQQYTGSKQDFESRLQQISRIDGDSRLKLPIIGRRLQEQRRDCLTQCQNDLQKCRQVSPEDTWVDTWTTRFHLSGGPSPTMVDWVKSNLPLVQPPVSEC